MKQFKEGDKAVITERNVGRFGIKKGTLVSIVFAGARHCIVQPIALESVNTFTVHIRYLQKMPAIPLTGPERLRRLRRPHWL